MGQIKLLFLLASASVTGTFVQSNGLTDMSQSRYAKIANTGMDVVHWTNGFWGEHFNVFSGASLRSMWNTWNTPEVSHGFRNFEIAIGVYRGEHWGPSFHDGDMYKWMEGVASVYAVNKDPELDKLMDNFIACVVKAQCADGYIHTLVVIEELSKGIDNHTQADSQQQTVIGTKVGSEGEKGTFINRLNFEACNLGHLMMAGIVHHRATGKVILFGTAVKATDFLCHFYEATPAELTRDATYPSYCMGVVKMYRATGNPRYLELSKNLIDIRGMVESDTDDNQDHIPFRDQYRAIGHAIRANYLYAGMADVYVETGEQQLIKSLTSIWNDIVIRRVYVTGACGALYGGTPLDGMCYESDSVQKVHQSYGRPYQLPNSTTHDEVCASTDSMLFSWRMLEMTGDAKYTELVGTYLYNSILSGVSLDGKKYFYTNPLRISADLFYTLRWPEERAGYISCFCYPPNTLRAFCQAQNYAYTLSPEGICCNLYSANTLTTNWRDKGELALVQETDCPQEGNIRVTLDKVPREAGTSSLFFRIPEWCGEAALIMNSQPMSISAEANTYAGVNRIQKRGDVVELVMDISVRLLEAHPLAEETRDQVVVKRGPLIYCLESMDVVDGEKIDNILIPAGMKLTPKKTAVEGSSIVALKGRARLASSEPQEGVLYRPVAQVEKAVDVRLIPYYTWGDRGKGEMTVWIPLARQPIVQKENEKVISNSYMPVGCTPAVSRRNLDFAAGE